MVRRFSALPIPRSWPSAQRQAARVCDLLPTGKPDLDNICKPILDSLQAAGVFKNDSAVDDLRMLRIIGGVPGTVNVFLEVM